MASGAGRRSIPVDEPASRTRGLDGGAHIGDGFARVTRAVLAVAVFATSFLFRFVRAHSEVTNDFFWHVASGRQMLLGELPVRDFFDPGQPLKSIISALAEMVGGHSVLSEVAVSLIFMSLGAVLVFLLATEASRSQVIGLLVTVLAVAIAPRLYAYPKIFLYPFAVWAMWRYLERPDRSRMVILAICAALAFLFRHDHGAYIGVAAAVTLLVHHWRDGAAAFSRAVAVFALVMAGLLSPYLLFVQANGGVVTHLLDGMEFTRAEVGAGARMPPRWTAAAVQGVGIRPPRASPRPTVSVRWTARGASDNGARAARERRYGLMHPDVQDQRTWTYELHDVSLENLLAILSDDDIEDTVGIDPAMSGSPRAPPEKRLLILEGLRTLVSANALPWLFYLFYAMPFMALAARGESPSL